jgi:WD40 repeat protein
MFYKLPKIGIRYKLNNIFKIVILLFILPSLALCAENIKPLVTIETSGIVSDFVEDGGYLYVATDAGVVDIVDLSSQKIVKQIHFAPMKTSTGEFVATRIHSIDRYKGKTLLVTSDISAYRNVWIDDGKELKKIIDAKKRLMPKVALFANDGKIIFGSFGSDVVLYDNDEGYKEYEKHISESTMGGMALSMDKKKMVISDESGTVRLIDVKSSKVEKLFSSEHVDNIYRVAYSNGTILTAGQDRRVGIYSLEKKAFHIKSDFLVYSVGLSPSGFTGVYSSGTEHNLQLFNTKSGKKGDVLVGHFATPNKILFINENAIISSGDENKIFFWQINSK